MAKCRKRKFRDEVAAKLALATIHRKDNANRADREQRAYRCPECRGAWHLTHQEKRRAA